MFKVVYRPKFRCFILGTFIEKNILNCFAPSKLSSGSTSAYHNEHGSKLRKCGLLVTPSRELGKPENCPEVSRFLLFLRPRFFNHDYNMYGDFILYIIYSLEYFYLLLPAMYDYCLNFIRVSQNLMTALVVEYILRRERSDAVPE